MYNHDRAVNSYAEKVLAANPVRITHEDIERALDELTEWPHFVEYQLDEGDSLTEQFTSTRGRTYGGPAKVTIIEGRDGITVRAR